MLKPPAPTKAKSSAVGPQEYRDNRVSPALYITATQNREAKNQVAPKNSPSFSKASRISTMVCMLAFHRWGFSRSLSTVTARFHPTKGRYRDTTFRLKNVPNSAL